VFEIIHVYINPLTEDPSMTNVLTKDFSVGNRYKGFHHLGMLTNDSCMAKYYE
jgi:hypothetical protein